MQADTEQILEDIATEFGVAVQWSSTVTDFRQDATGVDVTVDTPNGPATLRGSYLVACDGGRSTIRKLTGVGFSGTGATMACLIGDVELDDPPDQPMFLQRRERGTITAIQFRPGWFQVVTSEPQRTAGADGPVTMDELRASLRRVAGTDFGMHSPRWLSHFNDASPHCSGSMSKSRSCTGFHPPHRLQRRERLSERHAVGTRHPLPRLR